MSESVIKKHVIKALSQDYGAVIFNNPVGTFFAGKVIKKLKNSIQLLGGRGVACGLHEGMPDVIGWRRVVVTPDMVGRIIAVFVGVETKTETGSVRLAQKIVLDRLERDGALSGIARSTEDLAYIMTRLEGSMTDFALRISPELHAALAERAEEEGVSLNQLVLCELAQLVGKKPRSKKADRVSVEGFEELFEANQEQ